MDDKYVGLVVEDVGLFGRVMFWLGRIWVWLRRMSGWLGRNWFLEASPASPCVHSLGSYRSKPLRARDDRSSAGARIWA